ncbi:hypothetical protein ABQE93_12300 [Mycolicibacterium sp. XJ662]
MGLSWPLTGRTEQMKVIEAAIAASDVSGVLICGAEGVGKSRIARETLPALASRGYETRWTAGAAAARAIPLGAFTSWAPAGVSDTFTLLRGVIDSLTATSDDATVVLGVDDVHLLDDLSTFVLHQIVARDAAKVVLTVRDGEPIPPAIQQIWVKGRFDRIDLEPLSLDETTALLSATLRGRVDAEAARRLWRLTRGNVLYLQNIVEQEVAGGRLVQDDARWRWVGDPVMPPGLVELVESRIGDLPAVVGDVVDVVAVGEPIDLAALARITDAAAVEEAETRGLITLEAAGDGIEARVAHPLYGEVRRRRAPQSRLRRLRGLIATELAASAHPDDVRGVVRRATLSMESDLDPDVALLVKAAYGAVWLGELALADRIARAAVTAGAGAEPNFVRAHALSWLGRGEEAEHVLAGIGGDELTDRDRAKLAFLRCSNTCGCLVSPRGPKRSSTRPRGSPLPMPTLTSMPSEPSTGSRWTTPTKPLKHPSSLRWRISPSSARKWRGS